LDVGICEVDEGAISISGQLGMHLTHNVKFEDSQASAKPYHENLTITLAPQHEMLEFVCENNKPEHPR
jgi:hypothetical protein